MVTALGVSVGLTAAAIDSRAPAAQRQRWVPDLLTLDRIGAWALTEPGAGSDAFGAMRSTARRDPDGDGYILNGSKTFITNGPYADVLLFICKLDDGTTRQRPSGPVVRPRARMEGPSSPDRSARWGCTPRRRRGVRHGRSRR